MLRDNILNPLAEILDALDATCSGLRDPNRVRVDMGWRIYKHLAATLPPDPVEEEEEEAPAVEPVPETPPPAAKKTIRKKKEEQ